MFEWNVGELEIFRIESSGVHVNGIHGTEDVLENSFRLRIHVRNDSIGCDTRLHFIKIR